LLPFSVSTKPIFKTQLQRCHVWNCLLCFSMSFLKELRMSPSMVSILLVTFPHSSAR
jgi:hypothetical protein